MRGRTVGIDATTLEANAALRSIVRRETGEDDTTFLTHLAEASGMATPTRAELARFDRSRTKKTSNAEWTHPHDPDARVTKMKDGRTHLAYKAEHAVDLDSGAIVGVTVQGADTGDTALMVETLIAAAEQVESVLPDEPGIENVGGDKGYHSNDALVDLTALGTAQLPLGAGPGPPMLEGPAIGPRCRVCQSAADSRGARPSAPAVSRGVAGAAVRARVRDGRDAAGASSRASEHPETAARTRRRLQPRPAAASDDRRGHAPEPSGPDRGPLSCPVPAISPPVGPSGTPPAALHAALVADVFLAARPEHPLHFVSGRTYASGC